MERDNNPDLGPSTGGRWYDLFSRGARDWLRHNEKLRDSVRQALPEFVSGADVLTHPEHRVVKVPVRFLEHYRFRLRDTDSRTGAGQGHQPQPGDVLRPANQGGRGGGGAGSGEGGGVEFVLELNVDDVLDWIWDELELPNLEPRSGGGAEDVDFVREGWDRRGVRARLDRRRTLREAVKRRSVQGDAVPFSDEDLRYRQLTRRPRPTSVAVVIFALDVSSSMDEQCRKLAKTFFFWALQGLRRRHSRIESVFIGHTVNAWEFSEEEFFSARASGGTEASAVFRLAREVLAERYAPSRYNAYLFYASDGENFSADRDPAREELRLLSERLNFTGYTEVSRLSPERFNTEMGQLFSELIESGSQAGSYAISDYDDVWNAIREFFQRQAGVEAA